MLPSKYTCNKKINGANLKTEVEFMNFTYYYPAHLITLQISHKLNEDFFIKSDISPEMISTKLYVLNIYIRLYLKKKEKSLNGCLDYSEYCNLLKIQINRDKPNDYKTYLIYNAEDLLLINGCRESYIDYSTKTVFNKIINADENFVKEYCYMVKNIWYKSLGL